MKKLTAANHKAVLIEYFTMPKRLLKNAGFSAASQSVNIVLSFLFVPAYIFFLGIEGYGIYSFLLLIFSWITILQAGIEPAVIRMTAKYVAENKYSSINPLVTASLIFQAVIASLIGIAFYISSDYIASFIVKDEVGFYDETRTALYFSAINIIVLMYKNVYISLFKGLQRYDISSIYESLFNLLSALAAVLFLWLGYGIVGMILSRLALNLASVALLHFITKRVMTSFHLSLSISKNLIKEIYNYASWIVVGRVNRLAVNAIPPILIGMYVGPSGIAYYNISTKILQALNNLVASSISVIFPFVSELKALREPEKIKLTYLGTNRILSLISTPLYCFGAIYSWDLLYVWLGSDIANNSWLLMALFFIAYYLGSATIVPSTFALGLGSVKILAYTGFIQTIIVILTLPFLLKTFGILGAGLNYVLFELVSVVMVIIITTKIIKAPNFVFWVRDRLLLLFVSIAIFLVFIGMKYFLWESSMTRLETAVYLGFIFFTGISLYGIIIKSSNLVDQASKDQIAKIFHTTEK